MSDSACSRQVTSELSVRPGIGPWGHESLKAEKGSYLTTRHQKTSSLIPDANNDLAEGASLKLLIDASGFLESVDCVECRVELKLFELV